MWALKYAFLCIKFRNSGECINMGQDTLASSGVMARQMDSVTAAVDRQSATCLVMDNSVLLSF
jgi:hypothetical protein